jgi:amino acid adenylation domain-containing protein/non-ribosomal peptide synthase protein (TIGR01720 family)
VIEVTATEVEDVYPLGPLQEGILYHALLEPQASTYVLQQAFTISGSIDADRLEDAFQSVVGRHAALRTAFSWKLSERPLQVVFKHARLPVKREDWSGLSTGEREARLAAYLDADRRRGFELDRAPLLRLAIFRLAGGSLHLVLTSHHAVLDAWSEGRVFNEVIALYQAAGDESALPAPQPYSAFIAWLQDQDPCEAEAFWREHLRGFEAPTPLPLPVPARSSERAQPDREERAMRISPTGSEGLRAVARRERLTLSTILLGAWGLLLSRYSGCRDVVFGTVVSGRPVDLPGVEAMVGLFINSVPVRLSVDPRVALLPWLRELQRSRLRARRYEHSALRQVQSWSEVARGTPLFETMIAFTNDTLEATVPAGAGVSVAGLAADIRLTMPLVATVTPGSEIEVRLQFDARRFDGAAIEAMLGHLCNLLDEMAADPQRRLAELHLLKAQQRRRLLEDSNATATEHPEASCAHQLFEAQVERSPRAVALTFEERRLTYRELNRRANQVAHRLLRLGVEPDDRVGLCMRRSPELVASLLGILKAGAAYVPLDPGYPPRRLAFMLEDARVSILLTEAEVLSELPDLQATTIALDAEWELLGGEPTNDPECRAGTENLAYVIYTSGSTGTPKGVMIPHRGIVNYLAWGVRAYDAGAARGAPVQSSISFDLTLTSLLIPLSAGSTVDLLEEELGVDALTEALREKGDYSLVKITPAHLEAVGQQLAPEEAAGRARIFVIGGENLSSRSVRFWHQNAPDSVLVNEYGPTETVVGCCVYRVPSVLPDSATIPIGKPIANMRLHVLDSDLEPVPAGVPGELYIGGRGVARGYLGRPGLTASVFVPDPFETEPGGRLYRTGDLARYRPDGDLECLGRLDHQVKIRGYRIELGEVQAALGRHPGVRECVVVVRDDGPASPRLVAYALLAGEETPSRKALVAFLKETVPAYMVPSAFVFLPTLPLTPNGKVDTAALPAPESRPPDPADAYQLPHNEIEEKLALIWAQVLHVPAVGVRDNFFELGGDSILGIQIVARAAVAGLHITPRQLFQNQTVEELAAVSGAGVRVSAQQGPVTGPLPLTPIQRWFFELQLLDPARYNQAVFLESKHSLDRAARQLALDSLPRHHDALRLRFHHAPPGWQQAIGHPGMGVPLLDLDLSHLEPAAQDATAARTIEELHRGLELNRGPLFQAGVFRRGPAADWLFIVAHHLVMDGVSWGVLLEDLVCAYGQALADRPIELPRKTTSFKDWARGLVEHARLESLGEEAEFWLDLPSGLRPLPLDLPDGDNREGDTRSVDVDLDPEETATLVTWLPRAFGAQVQEALLGALAKGVAAWTGESALLVDLEGHGREDILDGADLSRTVGWFTSLYPVTLASPGARAPRDWLRDVGEHLRRVPGRGIGYGMLRYLRMDGDLSDRLRALPRPEISFNYLGRLDGLDVPEAPFREVAEGEAARAARGAGRDPLDRRSHLIEVLAEASGGRLRTSFYYSERLHRRETIEKLATAYRAALTELVAAAELGGGRLQRILSELGQD